MGNEEDEQDWNILLIVVDAEGLVEHFFGLDGLLKLMKHEFLVVTLNIFFFVILTICPYKIGNRAMIIMALKDKVDASQFEGLLTTLSGYCLFSIFLFIMYNVATIFGFRFFSRIIEFYYIVVKVSKIKK